MTHSSARTAGSTSTRRRKGWLRLVTVGAAAMALAACGSTAATSSSTSSSSSSAQGGSAASTPASTQTTTSGSDQIAHPTDAKTLGAAGSIKTAGLCPDSPMTVALLDGYGGNPWRKIVNAEFNNEAGNCPNIKVLYQNANGDPQAYASAVNSFVSQGVKVIVTYDDFGATTLPALRAAYKAGVQVVAHGSPISDTAVAGKDYTDLVIQSNVDAGRKWGTYLNKQLNGKGKVAYLWGTPANLSDPQFIAGFKETASPGITLLDPTPVPTNWDFGQTQKVLATFISQFPEIDAVMSSYGAAAAEGMKAFTDAGKPLPPLATISSDNYLACVWAQNHTKDPNFQVFSVDGTPNLVRIALRKGVAAAQNKPNAEASVIDMPVFMDTAAGVVPACNSKLPPGVDLSSDLSNAALTALFGSS